MKEILKVDMDNGTRYAFDGYDNYYVTNKHMVIEKGEQWVGYFELSHMIGFFVEKEMVGEL